MKIGIPKEIKNNENRVGATPAGVMELCSHGHTVYVQHTAGDGSGFSDDEYVAAGAHILPGIEDVYATAEMIIKVKEPIEPEYALVRKGQLLFTYFHFACDEELTKAMLVPGGGTVGRNAALMAAGLGAEVTITDISLPVLRHLAEVMPRNVHTLYSSRHNIEQELPRTDLVIGSVLIPGAKAPKLVTAEMVELLEPGSVMVDVAIDQGGCFETSHATTHADPVYEVDGVIHYAVANIPGAVPRTSTLALTNATLPYALRLADKGWRRAALDDPGLAEGVNITDGHITFKAVAEAWGMPYTPLADLL